MPFAVKRVDNLVAGIVPLVFGLVGVVYVIRDRRQYNWKVNGSLMFGALFSVGFGVFGLMASF